MRKKGDSRKLFRNVYHIEKDSMLVIDPGQTRAMVKLSMPFQLLLRKYKNYLGETILEIGPFFNPLITRARYHDKKIYYLDKEKHILNQFSKRGVPATHLILHDLNRLGRADYVSLKNKIRKALSSSNSGVDKFDSIIISQVFNYIDYKKFLMRMKRLMTKGGLMFLNNVIGIGQNLEFSEGTCGKSGQSVPVTDGGPHLAVRDVIVGGSA